MVEPPDRVVAACLARAEADRVRHFEVIGALRQGLLNGATTTLDAARTLTEEADRYVQAMLQIALDETTHKRGAPSGRFAVLGVGKLGGCELSLSSDLDVIFVYEALEGGYDVAAADYFNRVSQRLIALLSWAPAWRGSYDIDVRLRPHGEDGPLATPLSGMLDYLDRECWTWEFQALTRLRPVAGDTDLAGKVQAAALTAARSRSTQDVLAQVAYMRALMEQERPACDGWDVKLAPGGLVDVEFIAQALQLRHAADPNCVVIANTGAALAALQTRGWLGRRDAAVLRGTWALLSAVRQMQSALGERDLSKASVDHKTVLSQALGAPVGVVRSRLTGARARVRGLFEALVGPVRLSDAA